MFDIGFWELVVVGVVALLVVGPEDFPKLVRTAMGGISKARRMMAAMRDDLEREVGRADDLKRLVEDEVRLKELHDKLAELPKDLNIPSSIAIADGKKVDHDRANTAPADQDPAKEDLAGSNTRSR